MDERKYGQQVFIGAGGAGGFTEAAAKQLASQRAFAENIPDLDIGSTRRQIIFPATAAFAVPVLYPVTDENGVELPQQLSVTDFGSPVIFEAAEIDTAGLAARSQKSIDTPESSGFWTALDFTNFYREDESGRIHDYRLGALDFGFSAELESLDNIIGFRTLALVGTVYDSETSQINYGRAIYSSQILAPVSGSVRLSLEGTYIRYNLLDLRREAIADASARGMPFTGNKQNLRMSLACTIYQDSGESIFIVSSRFWAKHKLEGTDAERWEGATNAAS